MRARRIASRLSVQVLSEAPITAPASSTAIRIVSDRALSPVSPFDGSTRSPIHRGEPDNLVAASRHSPRRRELDSFLPAPADSIFEGDAIPQRREIPTVRRNRRKRRPLAPRRTETGEHRAYPDRL